MSSMRFVSSPTGANVLPKVFKFDSSPGYAIARAMGNLDPLSYTSELKEDRAGEQCYEIKMRQAMTEYDTAPHPLKRVGCIFWTKPIF